ncbi:MULTISPECIES: hypothetical protein [Streptomyces]|uniref:hypothetical protein n=1 Tax=Streptomyces TaxID=1883 RepID=UPI002271AE2F|nr:MULTISPECIES: hypothetical protein [unclassified Streptomyces]MCY0923292.1 hypothetical protein [Streptomyces sp. H27-G5]MCY0943965.1 hypothetical protein [Streptomyces sp. H34-AA3]MCY0956315.1 hypothetical protein [Streptomyces sp. H27-H5]MCZ4082335.1 hypothetical protein [Streptomyces sp. H34-S5]
MSKHAAQRRRFLILPRATRSEGSFSERRAPGSAWERPLPEAGFALAGETAPEVAILQRCLEGLKRQLLAEQSDEPLRFTPEAVEQTTAYVLSGHLDEVDVAELANTYAILRGFLGALAQEAEALLDTGRIVVRELVQRAHAMTEDRSEGCGCLQDAAATARDLLFLLEREGWRGDHHAPYEPRTDR